MVYSKRPVPSYILTYDEVTVVRDYKIEMLSAAEAHAFVAECINNERMIAEQQINALEADLERASVAASSYIEATTRLHRIEQYRYEANALMQQLQNARYPGHQVFVLPYVAWKELLFSLTLEETPYQNEHLRRVFRQIPVNFWLYITIHNDEGLEAHDREFYFRCYVGIQNGTAIGIIADNTLNIPKNELEEMLTRHKNEFAKDIGDILNTHTDEPSTGTATDP